MNTQERYEKIGEIIKNLIETNLEIPIIVEGEKDETTLRSLGCNGEIIKINIGIPIFNLCEKISKKHAEVIILTDWDRKGGQLCRQLTEKLSANEVKYDIKYRAELSRFCKKEIKDVEGLDFYAQFLSEFF